MPDFLGLPEYKQKEILGNLLFQSIQKHTDEVIAPKIMGLLIDFSVFGVGDILELLENENLLKERIEKAKELILPKVVDYIFIVLNIFLANTGSTSSRVLGHKSYPNRN